MNLHDVLDSLTREELLSFLHCKKTEISCLEQPHTLLRQLRDHNLLPEQLYQKVMRMKSKERRQNGVYEILDWIEKKKADSVHIFWFCVFQDRIIQQYPDLRLLRNSLTDGSFRFCENLPDPEDQTEREEEESTVKEKEKKKRGGGGGGKRKKSTDETEEEEQPGPSSGSTRKPKKLTKKPVFTTPVKRGEKQAIWTWPINKTTLHVTCGDKEGTLYRDKLPTGKECIKCEGRWFTPAGFEKFAGKGHCRNWKLSIRCHNTTLQKIIEEGHLQSPRPKRRCVQKSQKVLFPSSSSGSTSPDSESSAEMEGTSEDVLHERRTERGEEEEEEEEELDDVEEQVTPEEEEEEEEEESVDLSLFQSSTLPVSCASVNAVLHKDRFISGSRGRSIRTEERWLTPEDFVKQEMMGGHWRRDINCHGKILDYLLEKKILIVHSVLCDCDLCISERQNPFDQDNDDVCFICDTEGELVCCDECPRAFHQQCHLPAVQEDTLGDHWMCTFCVLHTNQRWLHADHTSQGDVLDSPVTQYTLQCEYLLLCLYKEDVQHVFTEDPTAEISDYKRVISKPMWLNRVKTKLQNKEYNKLGQFVADVRLIFHNCHIFNRDNPEFDGMGSRLSDVFERELQTIFNIE